MNIEGSIALVTGANRGIGRHFATQLLERGASKVYATARRPDTVTIPGAEVLRLDITDPSSVAEVAAVAQDVSILINNAGILTFTNLITGDLEEIHREMDTHFFGTLSMVRAFAPILAANGGGAVLNMLSSLSWVAADGVNAYSASKAAAWSLTNGIRLELAAQHTTVTGLHVGSVDTEMNAGSDYDGPKSDPADVAAAGLDAIQTGTFEVVVNDGSREIKASLIADPAVVYADALRAN
jgi:NAD(P)-dependent dehydrogenase (short-subunit alcohol dehydrogenase family)